MDPETLCTLASSCEEARQIDATHYEGRVKATLPFTAIRAHVFGEVLESDEPRSMKVALRGETVGLPGSFTGVADFVMADQGGTTYGRYRFELSILGRLDTLGKPALQMLAQRMATKFAEKVSRYLASRNA